MPRKKTLSKNGKTMGRIPTPIDEVQLEKLAMMMCTNQEIAAWFGVTDKTINSRFSEKIAIARQKGKISLRRKQYEVAMKGNIKMLIHLGKNGLGQADKVVNDTNLNITNLADIAAIMQAK